MWHALAHFFGMDNASGGQYLFWSGFGSDMTEFLVVGGVWKALNCHEYRCWRVGTKITTEPDGRHFRRCNKHQKVRHDTVA